MHYLLGDLQGCDDALARLLDLLAFSPSRDHLSVLGDLVNRGPASLATLERLKALGASATCLLGNHDLHLLAVAHGVRPPHRSDTLGPILDHPRRDDWIDWLRQRRLADLRDGWLLVHAGVAAAWDREQALGLAAEVEARLRGDDLPAFLHVMYGNQPDRWSDGLAGDDRLRFVVNTLTRIRWVHPDGRLDFASKEGAADAPAGLVPWFEAPGRRTAGVPIAFGHWSTLGLIDRPDLLALDTGCVWGGALSAMRVDGGRRELVQVPCAQAQVPGAPTQPAAAVGAGAGPGAAA
ncbi:symmetrical bis(5'-nucleosyl)-tetraphosphatase [Piscinibacter sakaiensis]|uniref:bis(5'-nucleosyl)-tetraphosphatase (symmetrical) n=1 Tax=Piscinibacter sakaiensis TaxID=1547922 RepID=A0A0K8NTR3_PISS1|nr:symmetrical bis(5'-nucleosyl)-tetraphosphatase [Piscinibacter sakaiensis]GAP33777.1 bis(5'-nucleosyl)-tetraphosphatase, symmetrical [Piscinibacter sakaiensis]